MSITTWVLPALREKTRKWQHLLRRARSPRERGASQARQMGSVRFLRCFLSLLLLHDELQFLLAASTTFKLQRRSPFLQPPRSDYSVRSWWGTLDINADVWFLLDVISTGSSPSSQHGMTRIARSSLIVDHVHHDPVLMTFLKCLFIRFNFYREWNWKTKMNKMTL